MSQRAVVIGLARSGLACARVLAAEGWEVLVVDREDGDRQRSLVPRLPASVATQLGGYTPEVVRGAALVCPSPGVRWDAPELVLARRLGIPVRSEMSLLLERCPGHVVGITGTNGKSTTSSLCAAILGQDGRRVHLGGNIGTTVLDRLDAVGADDWVVLELSSFQLESVEHPACQIGAVLNVTPDHLDRHGSFEDYAAIKQRLAAAATGHAVLGWDDPVTRAMAPSCRAPVLFFGRLDDAVEGATVVDDTVVIRAGGSSVPLLPLQDIPLFGPHNVLNVLAASLIGHLAGVAAADVAAAVRSFRAVPHRLQLVVEHGGVRWVNDSKATNGDAAARALESFGEAPLIWIGGGQSKGVPATELAAAVARRARLAILNGATAGALDAELAALGYPARIVVAGQDDAVEVAAAQAQPGDVVLLAPGYASFDQFADFEVRGEAFIAAVRRVTGPPA